MNVEFQRWHAPKILIRLIWLALAILLALQVCDVLSTIRFVHTLGIESEDNALVRLFFAWFGVAGLWLHKLLILPFVMSMGYILSQVSKKYIDDTKNRAILVVFLSFFLCVYIYLNAQFVATVISNIIVIP